MMMMMMVVDAIPIRCASNPLDLREQPRAWNVDVGLRVRHTPPRLRQRCVSNQCVQPANIPNLVVERPFGVEWLSAPVPRLEYSFHDNDQRVRVVRWDGRVPRVGTRHDGETSCRRVRATSLVVNCGVVVLVANWSLTPHSVPQTPCRLVI